MHIPMLFLYFCYRCVCTQCSPMSNGEESYCCKEHEPLLAKMEDFHDKFPDRPELSCITEHEFPSQLSESISTRSSIPLV